MFVFIFVKKVYVYRFPLYPEDGEVFGGEQDGSGATPTAPRTPDYNRSGKRFILRNRIIK